MCVTLSDNTAGIEMGRCPVTSLEDNSSSLWGFQPDLWLCPAGNQGEMVHFFPFSLGTPRSTGPMVGQVLRTPFVSDTALAMYYFLKQRLF